MDHEMTEAEAAALRGPPNYPKIPAKECQRGFNLGTIVATPGALEAIADSDQFALEFITRHRQGDWGEVCREDANENELSVRQGFRILSSYRTKKGVRLWVITEADRSSTTILLPEEY